MNKEIITNQAEVIARVFEKQTSHKMAQSTALEIVSALYGKKNYNVLANFIKPETAMAELGSHEAEHALDSQTNNYGDECVIMTLNGRKIKTAAYPNECDYVRITDRADNEIAYWVSDEWQESPTEVMGAIIGALNGGPDIELPTFATKKAKAMKVLTEPLNSAEIQNMLEERCTVIIPMDLDDWALGIDGVNDIAEGKIVGLNQVEIDGEMNSVSISDISYTPVGVENGSILIEVGFYIDTI